MKLFLVLCLVGPLAVFAHILPNEVETEFDEFSADFIDFKRPTEEQIQCITDAVKKIVEDNPDLDWWFEEARAAVEKLRERAKECEKLNSSLDKKRCFLQLGLAAKAEYVRLVKKLPNEKKKVVDDIRGAVKTCMKSS